MIYLLIDTGITIIVLGCAGFFLYYLHMIKKLYNPENNKYIGKYINGC
jgi:hypothetical protein